MTKKGFIYLIYNRTDYTIYGVYTDFKSMIYDYENINHDYSHVWIDLSLQQYEEFIKMSTTVIEEKWLYEQGKI